jgi:cupin 2 domain-containing protein
MIKKNIFANIPKKIPNEIFETIITDKNIKIEKIISKGHTSPAHGWYDQEKNEWVILLDGEASIEFEDKIVDLKKGDYINILANQKHKVIKTSKNPPAIWLAIFY